VVGRVALVGVLSGEPFGEGVVEVRRGRYQVGVGGSLIEVRAAEFQLSVADRPISERLAAGAYVAAARPDLGDERSAPRRPRPRREACLCLHGDGVLGIEVTNSDRR